MEQQVFLAEIEQVENLPEGERTAAYIDIIDRMNKQLFPTWEYEKKKIVSIIDLPVSGSGLTFGALCQQEQRDWRTGEPTRG